MNRINRLKSIATLLGVAALLGLLIPLSGCQTDNTAGTHRAKTKKKTSQSATKKTTSTDRAGNPNKPQHAPPPNRTERVNRPKPGHVWIPGHWSWSGSNYLWVSGLFVKEPRPGASYSPGRWKFGFDGYTWVPGRWK